MVLTGGRVRALGLLLAKLGRRSGGRERSAPSRSDLPAQAVDGVLDLYRRLGGVSPEPVLRPGPWDLVLDDGSVLELDEELHFNRFRGLTLDRSGAERLPWTGEYRRFAEDREADCLRAGQWGGRWTTAGSERMFGRGDPPGRLGAGGAPRWKQRALYDAMKDALAAAGAVRLIRLSVYDELDGAPLGAALSTGAGVTLPALAELLRSRSSRAGHGDR